MRKLKLDQQSIVLVLFLLIFILFSMFLKGFFSVGNLIVMVRSLAVLGILGLGMAIVVITRGIDLSMVAILAVPTAFILTFASDGMAVWLALLLGLCFAVILGLLNGFLVAYADIPALFATLATGLGIAGLGQINWVLKYDLVQWPEQLASVKMLGGAQVAGIPTSIIAFVVAAICVWWFLRRTKLGQFIYAIGDNPNAARTAGIPVRPITVLSYVLAALISVYAGLVLASSSDVMDTRIYNLSLIYDIVLVVVIGGVGLSGGRGGVWNVVLGTLLVGTVINGMTIMNFSLDTQNIIKGAVLLLAIGVDSIMNPRNEETAQQGDI